MDYLISFRCFVYSLLDMSCFYRATLRFARYCHDKLSVRPSVTLVDCDHTLEFFENNFTDD